MCLLLTPDIHFLKSYLFKYARTGKLILLTCVQKSTHKSHNARTAARCETNKILSWAGKAVYTCPSRQTVSYIWSKVVAKAPRILTKQVILGSDDWHIFSLKIFPVTTANRKVKSLQTSLLYCICTMKLSAFSNHLFYDKFVKFINLQSLEWWKHAHYTRCQRKIKNPSHVIYASSPGPRARRQLLQTWDLALFSEWPGWEDIGKWFIRKGMEKGLWNG